MFTDQPNDLTSREAFTSTRHQSKRSQSNLGSALRLEQAMFDWRSRHLILVLTLNYRPEYRNLITLTDLQRDRDNFLNNFRCNQLLQPINAYIWKIEEGESQGGLHLHVVLFYDRDFHRDIKLARRIGEYWATVITGGRGDYWNSNAHKAEFALKWGDATGQVNRHDAVKRDSLRRVLGYLTKDEQCVSDSNGVRFRTFGTSRPPDAELEQS